MARMDKPRAKNAPRLEDIYELSKHVTMNVTQFIIDERRDDSWRPYTPVAETSDIKTPSGTA